MDAWFEQRHWEWTWRLPVENKSTPLQLFSYTGTQNVNFFITAKKLRTFSVYCQIVGTIV
jgi:hypothetical protein